MCIQPSKYIRWDFAPQKSRWKRPLVRPCVQCVAVTSADPHFVFLFHLWIGLCAWVLSSKWARSCFVWRGGCLYLGSNYISTGICTLLCVWLRYCFCECSLSKKNIIHRRIFLRSFYSYELWITVPLLVLLGTEIVKRNWILILSPQGSIT
jgi:ABC-type Co2+ transport system permease subunit